MNRTRLALTAFAIVALTGCTSGPSLPSYGVVPDFTLTDQSGQPFDSKKHLDGKVWVANMIFTTCNGPCPRMSAQFRKLQTDLGGKADFRLVSLTIDPTRFTAPRLDAGYITTSSGTSKSVRYQ